MAIGDSGSQGTPELTAFQLEVARLFFALPESKGFLLAGGAALLAQHLTTRPTEDLDFFTAPGRGHVPAARDALEAAARQRGWSTEPIHDSDTFCRLVIEGGAARVLVDLAVNAPPDFPTSATVAAFANGYGGTMVFGIEKDEATVCGLDGIDPLRERDRLAQLVRRSSRQHRR